uniref:Kinase interacting protein n=1 Tax=Solanum tuberosum TaxID=4113 RepID=M1BZI4_SOLTU
MMLIALQNVLMITTRNGHSFWPYLKNCMTTISLWQTAIAALSKNHHRRNCFPTPSSHFDHDNDDQFEKEENNGSDIVDSDAESSLSYQPQFPSTQAKFEPDMIIADLVIRSVDCEIILHELSQRKVDELARFMLNKRDDYRVCVLSRKVEDLQGQLYGLERRNNEYYEQHAEEKRSRSKIGLKDCFKFPEEAVVGNVKKGEKFTVGNEVGKKVPKFWDKVKKLDIFLCAPIVNMRKRGCFYLKFAA